MSLSSDIRDREFDKFRGDSASSTKVAVAIEGDTGLIQGIEFDDIQVTYPTSLTENYAYYLSSVLQATIEVTYQDTAKKYLLRARRI